MITFNHNQQKGAVLVLALVLLTILTIIGVASMSSSTLEMKVASNTQQKNLAFQGALSRLEFLSSDNAANPVDFKTAIPDETDSNTWPILTCDSTDGCPNGTDWNATAVINYLGCFKNYGDSLEAGKGVSRRLWNARVTGQNGTGSATSVQAQGLRVTVAGCGET